MKGLPQISLRELLAIILFAGLGLASLRSGGILATSTSVLATVFFTCLAIVVVVGRRQLRILAIGYVIPIVIYLSILIVAGNKELDPYNGQLPTSQLLLRLYQVSATQEWTDARTGKVIPNYDPLVHGYPAGSGGMAISVNFSEKPDRRTFMTLGHILIATIFGYGGARFALAVHRKQQEGQNTQPKATISKQDD